MPLRNKTKQLTTLGLLGAATFVLSWLDSMIPLSGALPGAKLGLANLSVLCGLYLLGRKQGFLLCLLKILLQTALFGNAYSFFYGLSGGLLSFLVMALLLERASTVFLSVLGGMSHNLGQILVAAVVLKTPGLFGYLPVLMLCGLGAGAAIGVAGGILIGRLMPVLKKSAGNP